MPFCIVVSTVTEFEHHINAVNRRQYEARQSLICTLLEAGSALEVYVCITFSRFGDNDEPGPTWKQTGTGWPPGMPAAQLISMNTYTCSVTQRAFYSCPQCGWPVRRCNGPETTKA